MKKHPSSLRLHSLISITALLLIQLSCPTLLFAAPSGSSCLPILKHSIPTKITHGPSVVITSEGSERIESVNGSVIN